MRWAAAPIQDRRTPTNANRSEHCVIGYAGDPETWDLVSSAESLPG